MENKSKVEDKVEIKGAADFLVHKEKGRYSLPKFKVDDGLKFTDEFLEVQYVKGEAKTPKLVFLDTKHKPDTQALVWYDEEDDKYYPLKSDLLVLNNQLFLAKCTLAKQQDGEVYYRVKEVNEQPINSPIGGILVLPKNMVDADYISIDLENLPELAYTVAVLKEEVNTPVEGVTTEGLLGMLIYDLIEKQKEVPSKETMRAIEKLEEAQLWLMKRTLDRLARGVLNTYKQ